ncbi:MAG: 30S ribosomal protein S1 [Desulfomicrobium apsheronum]|uniref:Small ribosomal subunit protein bS1 n=2 Tax=Desulfomicrobium TaxID=898 RepID=A0A8G2C1F0_DESNO|nr:MULTISPECIES: 30S ribosomal protein S1 [Desulfomicrobium]MBE1424428.1 small subunit ribosomal protein S1 [Desulfomicrobium macestii]MDY0225843.1 30S ribosomal protein S1 [Desulfomicrobium apsheronum]SFL50439.1 small subunit ribosomal protein S1 [Desulfomicrobium norvegicum]
MNNTQTTPESMNDFDMEMDFESQLENYLNSDFGDIEEGVIVSGEVVKIDDSYILVDVNFKSEGQIPLDEFMENGQVTVKVGDTVDVYVVRKNEREGSIVLSREKAKRMQVLDELEKLLDSGDVVVGRIVRRIKGGYVVEIKGIEAFLPGSHVDLRPVPDMDALVNQDFEFRVLKINRRRSNVIVSRRVLLEEDRDRKRGELLTTLEEGQSVSGVVKNITEYGVFIDLGGLDGLLHITDMSWKRIKHPKEMVQLGDELTLKVLSFDKDEKKVSLGLKQLVMDPWANISEKYPEGHKLTGKVTNLVDYGAFVELEAGVEGLVHISEMSWTRKLRHPSQMVRPGDEVDVIILGVDVDRKRISLGMKQVAPNPWDLVAEKYPEGTILEASVKNITEFGLFIGIEDGIDGLIHVSDLSWTKKIRHPNELYKVGDVVRAKVLTVDKENEKFTLGIKQLADDPWLDVPNRYPVGTMLTGTITNITDFGLFVEVEEGIEGLVHVSEMSKKKIKSPKEAFNEGDSIEAKVIHVSADERRLGLSLKAQEPERKRSGGAGEFRTTQSGSMTGSNLGDMIRQKMEENAENGSEPEAETEAGTEEE